jgi:ferrous iron transport protein A
MPDLAPPSNPSASLEMGLNALPRHVDAQVVRLLGADTPGQHELMLRLLEIGFLPGERVRVMAHGYPGAEPLAVRVGHTTFALRGHEAALVRVVPITGVQA